MNNSMYKGFYRLCLILAEHCTGHYDVSRTADEEVSPAVYLVHHQNLRGPFITMIWFDEFLRLWVLNVFCDRKTCFHQFYNYTFTKRFGLPKVIAAIISYLISFFVSGLMHTIHAIPVYRGSKAIMKTFKESISALTNDQSILICPDRNYKDKSSCIGEMYDGFLYLEKYYRKQTNRHLAFVPLHINNSTRTIKVGQAVYFNDENDFKHERALVYDRLKQEFSRLESLD